MKNKIDKFEHQNEWTNWIGLTIEKYSGKPFKSGSKFATPDRVETNPNYGKLAFHLIEDGTLVDCYQCKLKTI